MLALVKHTGEVYLGGDWNGAMGTPSIGKRGRRRDRLESLLKDSTRREARSEPAGIYAEERLLAIHHRKEGLEIEELQ